MIRPSYQQGFARSAGESEYPEVWRGLIGAWAPSLGNTGLVLRDLSGNENHGTLTNGPTWTSGTNRVGGPSIQIDRDAGNQYIDLSSTFERSIRTFSCWFKFTGDTSTSTEYTILSNDGTFVLDEVINSAAISIEDSEWHQVGFTEDSTGAIEFYVDGKSVGAAAGTSTGPLQFRYDAASNRLEFVAWSPVASYGSAKIGRSVVSTADYGDFQIDDIRIYDRDLSSQEIWQLYVNPLAPFRKRRRVLFGPPAAGGGGATPKGIFNNPFVGPFGGAI